MATVKVRQGMMVVEALPLWELEARLEQAFDVIAPVAGLEAFGLLLLTVLPEAFADAGEASEPTQELPGSVGKQHVLAGREERGEELFREGDVDDDPDRGILPGPTLGRTHSARTCNGEVLPAEQVVGLRCTDEGYEVRGSDYRPKTVREPVRHTVSGCVGRETRSLYPTQAPPSGEPG